MLKKIIAGITIAVAMIGCAQLQITAASAKSQKDLVCSQISAVGDAIKATPNAVTPDQQAELDRIAPYITNVCNTQIPAQLDWAALANQGVPVVLKVIDAATLPVDQKTQLVFGINLASSLIKQQIVEEHGEASAAK